MSNTTDASSQRATASRRKKARAAATITVIGGSLVIDGQPAGAASFEVTNTNASGPGSLSQAIADANATTAADTITFSGGGASGTITLDGATNKIKHDLTIVGPGQTALTLTNASGGVLYVYNEADLVVSGITIANVGGTEARAIFSDDGGDLTITDVTVDTTSGRGIEVNHESDEELDDVTLTNVDVIDTGLDGVYVNEAFDVFMDGVTVTGAGTSLEGDGIDVEDVNDLTILNSTVSASFGRGIEVYPIIGELIVTDTNVIDNGDDGLYWDAEDPSSAATITRVDASGNGGTGILIYEGGPTELLDVRSFSNGELGIYVGEAYGDLTMSNIVVSNNVDGGLYANDSDAGGVLTINGLTDTIVVGADTFVGNGDGAGSSWGVYVAAWGDDVIVSDVSITGEFWIDSVDGDVEVSDTTVVRNVDGFDVLYPQVYLRGIAGDLTVDNVTISDANEEGLLIGDVDGATTIDDLTVSGSGKEAIFLTISAGSTTITNSTIADNDVSTTYVVKVVDSDVTIAHSTIAGNSNTGGAAAIGLDGTSNLVLEHSIVADNDDDLSHAGGASTTAEYSLVETGSGLAGTNIETTDPKLGPLQDNGGDTPTRLPLAGSPAIDAGNPSIAGEPETDQRGGDRIVGARIDVGAVEVDSGAASVADATVSETDGSVDVVVSRSGFGDGAASVTVTTSDGTAEAGADFTPVSTTVSWASGDATDKIVSVPITADRLIEGDETFGVALSAASGVAVGTPASATVTITDEFGPALNSLAPRRFVDTRTNGETFDGGNEKTGKLVAGGEIEVQIAGRGGIPDDAVGVVMNVTAIGAEGNGFVTAHGCVTPRPGTSSLNYTAGVNLGNEVIAGLSSEGKVCLYSSNAANLAVDVVGYIGADSPLINVTPARLLDTRPNGETVDDLAKGAGKTTAGGEVTLKVAGRAGVPTDAAAVIVNVTAINPSGTGYVTVTPCVSPLPTASSLNYAAGANRGNELVASLDSDGELCLFTSSSVDLAVDVVGYLPAGTSVTSVSPARLLETRPGQVTADGQSQAIGKLGAGDAVTLPVAGRVGVPTSAKAVVVNVTAIAPEANGFVTLHPCLPTLPLASSLNYVPGVNGGNEVIAQLDASGNLCVFTSAAAHIAVDIVAYLD